MSQASERLRAIRDVSSWRSSWHQTSTITKLHWILRLAVAGEFIGHGAYGVMLGGRAAWVPYFGVVGLSPAAAYSLMPLVGLVDITVGFVTLFFPIRLFLLYATVWGFWTALLRPLAGEGIWELLERAGNYGIPFALLYLSGWGHGIRSWVAERIVPSLTLTKAARLIWVLRITTATLLIGHGGIGAFVQKAVWNNYFGVLGISPTTVKALALIPLVGWFEILLGVAVFLKPIRPLLLFVFAWKVFTEFLRLPSGELVFEFLERFGSYAAPLALLYLTLWMQQTSTSKETFPTSEAAT